MSKKIITEYYENGKLVKREIVEDDEKEGINTTTLNPLMQELGDTFKGKWVSCGTECSNCKNFERETYGGYRMPIKLGVNDG